MCKDIVELARLKASILAFIESNRKYCFSRNAPFYINNALRRIFALVLICNDIVKLNRLNKVASDIFIKFITKIYKISLTILVNDDTIESTKGERPRISNWR